jgi:DNA-directed RNA polymerase II subunit RPB2
MPKKSKTTNVSNATQPVEVNKNTINVNGINADSSAKKQGLSTKESHANSTVDASVSTPLIDFAGLFESPMEKDAVWDVIDAFFGQHNGRQLIAHQYDSYQQFMEKYLDDVIKQFNPIKVFHDYREKFNKHALEVNIEFMDYAIGNPTITEPDGETIPMTPAMAKLRNLTYSAPLTINMKFSRIVRSRDESKPEDNLDQENYKEVVMRNINFGRIPIMVQSKYCQLRKNDGVSQEQYGECKYDMGGYFLINGNEKVVVSQERIAENKIFVFSKQKQNKNREFEAEIRSIRDDCFSVVMTNIVKFCERPKSLYLNVATLFKNPVNVFLVMRALGVATDIDLIRCVCGDEADGDIGSHIALLCKETLHDFKETCLSENVHTPAEVMGYLVKHFKYKGLNKDIRLSDADKLAYLKSNIDAELLPHLRTNSVKKVNFLGAMCRKLLKVRLGLLPYDDRDSFQNKRVETTGCLFASLFRQCLNRLVKDLQRSIGKELNHNKSGKDIFELITINNIYKIIKSTSIEGGIKYSLATGNWGVKTNGKGNIKIGAAQVLNRLSYSSYLSHERRINCPSDKKKKNNKIVGPRKQHASQFGYICPAETPEGATVGLVKNMAIGCVITLQSNSAPVKEWLATRTGITPLTLSNFKESAGKCIIYVNGDIMGYHPHPDRVYNQFLHLRRCGKFNPYISINWDILNNEMFIFSDAGRLTRPVLIADENQLRITSGHIEKLRANNGNWNALVMPTLDRAIQRLPIDWYLANRPAELLKDYFYYSPDDRKAQCVVEFIDTEEVNNCMIAMTLDDLKQAKARETASGEVGTQYITRYTHCEIHPGLMLGVLACVIPFPDHSQSPRNAYQSSMGKQAMSCYATNFLKRLDTIGYVMNYLEKAVVASKFGKYIHYNELPIGLNAIVAICAYTGYNQEDSIMLNGHSVDMGFFRSTYYHTYRDDEKKIQSNGKEEKFCKPDPEYTKGIKPGNYDKLDERGFVRENEYVTSKDVIMGKKLPLKNKYLNGHQVYKDCSTSLRMNETGYVDKVFIDRNEEGFLSGKIRIRNERIPSIGSKFASRVGQKGTVGMIYPQEHMPFTKDGLVPDIIMTPHAIPSRMTIGQLLECIIGKASVHLGGYSECTAFSDIDPHKVGNILEANGFDYCGNEVLYSGITGKQMDVQIFMGPTYYQRLKHMVEDKMHCADSNHQVLTGRGWVPIAEVTMSDKVATLSATGVIEYQHPTAIHHYPDFEGEMYEIENSNLSLNVTSNHRMYVSRIYGRKKLWKPYKLEQAKDINGVLVKYKKNGTWSQPDYQFVLPEMTDRQQKLKPAKIVDMNAWLTFFGIWMAEGCCYTPSDPNVKTNSIYVAVHKQRVKDAIYPALTTLGYNYNVYNNNLVINDYQLYQVMAPLSVGATNKTLPDWVWNLSSAQCQLLLNSMVLGDGSYKKSNPNQYIYYTGSVKLADDFMRLALHCGWCSNKTEHIPAGTSNTKKDGSVINTHCTIWRLSVIKDRCEPFVNHGHTQTQSVQTERLYHAKVPVYCITVPNKTFYIRRNGKAVWTGNSRNSGPVVQLTRQPAEGRARDGGLRLGEMEKDCMNAHGSVAFLKERMLDVSDGFDVFICGSCGNYAVVNTNPDSNIYRCDCCDNYSSFRRVTIPYAAKLLSQELQGMGLNMKFLFENNLPKKY